MPLLSLFRPFRALRYDDPSPDAGDGVVDVSAVLQEGSPYHPLLMEEAGTLERWQEEGLVKVDAEAVLYLWRVGWKDGDGRSQQRGFVVGVRGDGRAAGRPAVQAAPETAEIAAPSFSDLLVPTGSPLVRATTADGVHHRVWALAQLGVQQTIVDAVERWLDPDATGFLAIAEATDAAEPPIVLPAGVVMHAQR